VPEVAVVTVRPERVALTVELPGRVAAYRAAEVRPQVSGIVRRRVFREGSDVRAGELLYEIDPDSYEAALASARGALARAEASLPALRARVARYKDLVPEKAVSRQDYEDAAAALQQAEADVAYWRAAVETAQIALARTRVTAPIAGRIGKSYVAEGALVTAHQPQALAVIQQIDPVYVDVPRSAAEILRLERRLGGGAVAGRGGGSAKVRLVLEDGSLYPHEGVLQFRDVTVDPGTGSVTVRILAPNPQGVLLPGMFVRALVKEGVDPRALLVPQQAVMRGPAGDAAVLVVDAQGRAQARPVALDRAVGDRWLVASGLSPGDRVVVEGIQKVRPGAPVRAVPFASGKAP